MQPTTHALNTYNKLEYLLQLVNVLLGKALSVFYKWVKVLEKSLLYK